MSLWACAQRPTWRRIGTLLVLTLALAAAACGSSTAGTGPGVQPTATPKPTATPTPVPSVVWRLVTSPNPTSTPESTLGAATALSSTDAWAVGGAYVQANSAKSLIERWDGAAWHIVANPGADFLNGVAAVSTNDVWAVGGSFNYGVGNHSNKPLIMHWNGTQWSVISSPETHANAVQLNSVVALAANTVWAVGEADMGDQHVTQQLIERWDGARWQVVSTPLPSGSAESALKAIATIPGSQRLWAVGYVQPRTSPSYAKPLIEQWDGSAWRTASSLTLPQGAFGATLRGVVALSATDAWAVGEYTASNHTIRALVLHWDGATWTNVSSPDTWGSLSSVVATSANDVRVVGHATAGDGNQQTALVMQWDGSTWHRIAPPTPSGASHSDLAGVTVDSAGTFWAVGAYRSAPGHLKTLIERCP